MITTLKTSTKTAICPACHHIVTFAYVIEGCPKSQTHREARCSRCLLYVPLSIPKEELDKTGCSS